VGVVAAERFAAKDTKQIANPINFCKRVTFPPGLFGSDVMVWRSVHLF